MWGVKRAEMASAVLKPTGVSARSGPKRLRLTVKKLPLAAGFSSFSLNLNSRLVSTDSHNFSSILPECGVLQGSAVGPLQFCSAAEHLSTRYLSMNMWERLRPHISRYLPLIGRRGHGTGGCLRWRAQTNISSSGFLDPAALIPAVSHLQVVWFTSN